VLEAPHVSSRVSAAPRAAAAPTVRAALVRAAIPLFAATLFLSSFLMFAVEPMVARQLLPVLGGVPMVWNGCVVFFQAVLLLGYGGAHVLTRWFGASPRLVVYAGLAVLPLAFLRLGVDPASAAHATSAPLAWLLLALVTSVGPAFLALAVSASVLQSSLASSDHESSRDPYFLYVASNAGSLAALVAYPTVIEPWLGLSQQARVWTIGYGVFVALLMACAVVTRYALSGGRPEGLQLPASTVDAAAPSITWAQRGRWCLLACVPSSLMLGVTTSLTTDIAPIPMLWVVPLGLYLATFMLAFSGLQPRATALANRFLPSLLLALALILLLRVTLPIGFGLLVHLLPFFAAAMMCHGRLAESRPAPRHLTEFYFWLAFGGMAGGLFNTLVAPAAFSSVLEYPIALAVVALLRPAASPAAPRHALDVWLPVVAAAVMTALVFAPWTSRHMPFVIAALAMLAVFAMTRRHRPATFAAVAGLMLVAAPWVDARTHSTLHRERTFFGSYVVAEDRERHRVLTHGTTLHGMQSVDAARQHEPLTYYHRSGPFGRMMARIPRLNEPGDVAAIGLGVGTLASYARPGQHWTFYEIDPAVERIARDDRYFTFLRQCGEACRVVLGDARLSMAAAPDARYQLIALDAFSSDAIPMHLLTNEAMQVYLARLAPGGVLAFHISNRHLHLNGIVARLASANGLVAREMVDTRKSDIKEKSASHWVVLARSLGDLGGLADAPEWSVPRPRGATPLWTDDFSSLLGVLHFGKH
jgi:hypothetical protein